MFFYVDIFSITYLILVSNQKRWFPTLREEPGTGVHIKKSSKGKCKKTQPKKSFFMASEDALITVNAVLDSLK